MAYQARGSGRIGRAGYWKYFFTIGFGMLFLMFAGITTLLSGSVGGAAIAFLLLVPLGIYYRVIMMRRCRDIGWPAWLPWAFLAVNFLLMGSTIYNLFEMVKSGAAMAPGAADMSVLGLFNIAAWGDTLFALILGFAPGQRRAEPVYNVLETHRHYVPAQRIADNPQGFSGAPPVDIFADRPLMKPATPSPMPDAAIASADTGTASQDAAIARALEAYKAKQAGEAGMTAAQPAGQSPAPEGIAAPPRAAGFGRKGL